MAILLPYGCEFIAHNYRVHFRIVFTIYQLNLLIGGDHPSYPVPYTSTGKRQYSTGQQK